MQVRIQVSLPRDERYVTLLRDVADCVLRGAEAPVEVTDDIRLALSEACNNAIRHAEDSNSYDVAMVVGTDCCEIEVCDFGPGFAPSENPEPSLESESGRGVHLMQALVDDLKFTRHDDGTHVTLRKSFNGVPLPANPQD